MLRIVFTKIAKKQFEKMEESVKQQVLKKLQTLKSAEFPESYLRPLYDLAPATHRLRIGSHRLILFCQNDKWHILKIGHRKNIYQISAR